MRVVKKSSFIYLRAVLKGKAYKALLDTGAEVSLVSEKIAIERDISFEKINTRLKGANGKQLEVLGEFVHEISIQGETALHIFFVVRDLQQDMILGINWLCGREFEIRG